MVEVLKREDITVELVRYPTHEDWMMAKRAALVTIGKTPVTEPTLEWKERSLISEHSYIRTLPVSVLMKIPYFVSVHLVRHKIGVEHFVRSQRDDRNTDTIPRDEYPQGAAVSHLMSGNAASFITIVRKRLCAQADKTTQYVARLIRDQLLDKCPEFKSVLVPPCVFNGGVCHEFNPCTGVTPYFKA